MSVMEKRVKLKVITSNVLHCPALGDFRLRTETAKLYAERVPLDYNHDDAAIIGYAENFVFTESEIVADGVILLGEDAPIEARNFAHNFGGGAPYEVSALLDLSGATETFEGNVAIYDGAVIRGVAICPHGTDWNTSVKLYASKTQRRDALVCLSKKEEEMTGNTPTNNDVQNQNAATERDTLEAMIEEFGLESGVAYFRAGLSLDEARTRDYEELRQGRAAATQEKDAELSASIVALRQDIAVLKTLARRGDAYGLSAAFQDEDPLVVARVLSPLEAAAAKFGKKRGCN